MAMVLEKYDRLMAVWRASEYAPPPDRTPGEAASHGFWFLDLLPATGWTGLILGTLSFALPYLYVWDKQRRYVDAVAYELERIRKVRMERIPQMASAAKPLSRRRAITNAVALNESARQLRRSMRGSTTKEKAGIIAGAVTALVITGWLAVLALAFLSAG
jgi:hypothetical protein